MICFVVFIKITEKWNRLITSLQFTTTMDFQTIKSTICYLNFFIIFMHTIDTTSNSSVTLKDLSKICCIDKGTKEISSINSDAICTAIAKYSNNFETTMEDIEKLRENFKYVYIINHYTFEELTARICSEDTIDGFITEINVCIAQNKIDVLIFDNLDSGKISSKTDHDFQTKIYSLFTKLKEYNPGMLFGLSLNKDKDVLDNAYDPLLLDDVVDLYLAKTYSYNKCVFVDEPYGTTRTSPISNMIDTIKNIKSLGYNLEKTILIVQIVVNDVDAKSDISYSDFCIVGMQVDIDPHRRYCIDNLLNYFKKGKIAYDNKMPGVFIQSLDRDDCKHFCSCSSFPVLHAIDGGFKNLADHSPVTGCVNLSLMPKDRIDTQQNIIVSSRIPAEDGCLTVF